MTQPRSTSAEPAAPARLSARAETGALPLSVIHAEALYRPVPPVEYDPIGDSALSGVTSSKLNLTATLRID